MASRASGYSCSQSFRPLTFTEAEAEQGRNQRATRASEVATALSPFLAVKGKLVRRDGAVLWQQQINLRNGEFNHPGDEYAASPALLREGYLRTTREIVQEFLEDLRG